MRRLLARLGASAVALLLGGLSVSGVAAEAEATQANDGPRLTDSAVTVSGSGEFSDLRVTVSQTTELVNQVVTVSWEGGTETYPSTGFDRHYLQMMQCWGDAESGPTREQCQFGAGGDARGQGWAPARQLSYGSFIPGGDPLETFAEPELGQPAVYAPFRPVRGQPVLDGAGGEYFGVNTTNEIRYARTRPNGTGLEYFETQTALEAPGLRCGEPLSQADGSVRGRSCWLVIIPRGATEVNGEDRSRPTAANRNRDYLESSPLSLSNWQHRLVVKLEFQPVATACPLGNAERPLIGHELAAEAVTQWQPELCTSGDATFSFSQLTDEAARRQLASDDPELAIVTTPLPSSQAQDERPYVYAPVAISGLALGYVIERQAFPSAPPAERARDGERISGLKLNQRLVAKLLTQFYRFAVHPSAEHVKANPTSLVTDPEFLALNPGFPVGRLTGPYDALVSFNRADVSAELWRWVLEDDDARAFLTGKPDPNGYTVNPYYKGLSEAVPEFPKSDPTCVAFPNFPGSTELCTLDAHPYAADMLSGARAVSRGESLARNVWCPFCLPAAWKEAEPQPNGRRSLVTVTDTASMDRYNLEPILLPNANGEFVAPTEDALLAALEGMTKDPSTGVLVPNVSTTTPGAYPLTSISYAATAPSQLDEAAGSDYADFLEYVSSENAQTPGVRPGELALGYAPLPADLRRATQQAADTIRSDAGKPWQKPVTGGTAELGGVDGGFDTAFEGGFDSGFSEFSDAADSFANGGVENGGEIGPEAPPAVSEELTAAPPATAKVSAETPAIPVGVGRYGLLVPLSLGVLAAVMGPVLLRLSKRGVA